MKEELEELDSKIDIIRQELDILNNNDVINWYNKLRYKYEDLITLRKEIYKKVKIEEFSNCNHIWVNNELNSRYCIKCHLNTIYNYLELMNNDNLNEEEKIVFDYLNTLGIDSLKKGVYLDIDKDKALNLYKLINLIYPDASDEIILKYLNMSIYEYDEKKLSRTNN